LEYWIGQVGGDNASAFAHVFPSLYDYLTTTAESAYRFAVAPVAGFLAAWRRLRKCTFGK